MRRGFTLVEVLVALVILELGLLGVVGTVVLASRSMTLAERRERAVMEAELVLDSLEGVAAGGRGVRTGSWGEIVWRRSASGRVHLRIHPRDGRAYPVESWVPVAETGRR